MRIWIVWAMKPSNQRQEPMDWATAQLQGTARHVPEAGRIQCSPSCSRRRRDDSRFHSLDWHSAHLLAVSIGILLLSVADAFMTVTLLAGGAVEVNPIMAAVVYKSAALFAALKMAMTGCGVILMVMLARYRFMRLVRVDVVMYVLLIGYLMLLTYEFWMLRELISPFDF